MPTDHSAPKNLEDVRVELSRLLSAIAGDDETRRRDAVVALFRQSRKFEKAENWGTIQTALSDSNVLALLLFALQHDDAEVRYRAAVNLRRQAHSLPIEAGHSLFAALKDTDERVRRTAAKALVWCVADTPSSSLGAHFKPIFEEMGYDVKPIKSRDHNDILFLRYARDQKLAAFAAKLESREFPPDEANPGPIDLTIAEEVGIIPPLKTEHEPHPGPSTNIESALDQLAELRLSVAEIQWEIARQIEAVINRFAGRSFGSLKANGDFAREVNQLLEATGTRLQCPVCSNPRAILHVQRFGTTQNGAFQHQHPADNRSRRARHGGKTVVPEVKVVPLAVELNSPHLAPSPSS